MFIKSKKLLLSLSEERLKEHYKKNYIISQGVEPSLEQLNELIYQKDSNGNFELKDAAKLILNSYYTMFEEILIQNEAKESMRHVCKEYVAEIGDFVRPKEALFSKFINHFKEEFEKLISSSIKDDRRVYKIDITVVNNS